MMEIEDAALHSLSYGMYIISAGNGEKYNGQIANVVSQVTSSPRRLAICINKENLTNEYISTSGFFGVSVLEQETPMKFIGTFGFKSGRDIDKFSEAKFEVTQNGTPLVQDHAISLLECKVVNTMETETHVLYVGELVSSKVLKKAVPMTYAYYHEVKKGKTQKNAPTFHVD